MYKVFQFNLDPNDMTIRLVGCIIIQPSMRFIIRLDLIYETVKEIPTEIQSALWYKRQYTQGNLIQYNLRRYLAAGSFMLGNPSNRILYQVNERLNMMLLKRAYAILECI